MSLSTNQIKRIRKMYHLGMPVENIAQQMRTSTERVKELVKGVKRKDERHPSEKLNRTSNGESLSD